MAKNTNTFLKKKRELDKKAKAEEKLARRIARKKRANESDTSEGDANVADDSLHQLTNESPD